MNPIKLESESNFDLSTLSETLSTATEEESRNLDFEIKGAAEPKRKVKKLRSIRLVKLPSLRLTTQPRQIQSDYLSILSSDEASLLQLTQVEMPEASPNYMKTTTSSDAKKESLQKSARTLIRRSSFKSAKSLARLPSTKFRRSLMRKSSGEADMKKKLKKAKTIKLGKRFSIVLRDDADATPNHLKAAGYADGENTRSQASCYDSKSNQSCNDVNKRSYNLNMDKKSARVITRTRSLRPPRILTRTASLRTKRPSMKTSSQMLNSTVHQATCSSALKESKIADHLELQPGGSASEGVSVKKVCPYSYCSLHGHKHSNVPPLKRFVSMRRRMLKTQKSIKLEGQSFRRAKQSSNTKKGNRRSEMASQRDVPVLETAQKSRSVTKNRKVAGPEADLNGERRNDRDGADTIHSERVEENMIGERSHRHLCSKEKQEGSLPTMEESAASLRLMETETTEECCTDEKEEGIMESNSKNCVLTLDQPENVDFSLKNIQTPGQCDMMCTEESDCIHHEEIPVGGVHKEVNGDGILSLNLDMLKGDSELNNSQADPSTRVDELFNKPRIQTPNEFVESEAITGMDSSAPTRELLEEQTVEKEESTEDSSADSESDSNTDVIDKTGPEKPKNTNLWNLIYQHMVSGIAEGDEIQSLNKMKEEQGDDANVLSGRIETGTCTDASEVGQNMGVKDHDRGSTKMQLYERNTIRLVQEAFDKILSEIPDHMCDDQSIDNDTISENNHGNGREISISTSFDSGKEGTVQDQVEMNFTGDKINGPEGQNAEAKTGSISTQQTPKSWSNLKKVLILRRFVKALEKVRNINPQKPRHLPLQPEAEAEKINLRHQTTGEKKNSEEWMLDHALQQVLSTLAPAQKRKVAMLVQAFETVGPLPESDMSPSSDIAASLHTTPVQTCSASTYQRDSETGKAKNFGISLRQTCSEMQSKENPDQVCNSFMAEKHIPDSFREFKETSSESGRVSKALNNLASETAAAGLKADFEAPCLANENYISIVNNSQPESSENHLLSLGEHSLCDQPSPKSADFARTSHDGLLMNREGLKEVCFLSSSEAQDSAFRLNCQKLPSKNQINATAEKSDEFKSQSLERLEGSIADSNVVTSVPVSEMAEESSKATEVKTVLQNKFLVLNMQDESKFSSADLVQEKPKNMRMWYLIYKHMVSGTEKELNEATPEEEQRDDTSTSNGKQNEISNRGFPVTSQDIDMENHSTDNQKIELQQIEAIRMVEEAIDEISLPDSQHDSPDDQLITKGIISDQEHLERQPDRGDLCISSSIYCTKKSRGESNNNRVEQRTPDSEEPYQSSNKETPELNQDNKPKLSTQKSWSNVKKLILLRKFVKAMEKVKTFNPQEPRFLPFDPENEPEKVHLRHQGMADRKNSDEWMLDYALQQVVAKLTPARKRKVELLVEAFETVMPTMGSSKYSNA